jgi:hypothetical protein
MIVAMVPDFCSDCRRSAARRQCIAAALAHEARELAHDRGLRRLAPEYQPAIEMTISSNGASENIVKYAIAAAWLIASWLEKPETVSLIRSQILRNIPYRPCRSDFSKQKRGRRGVFRHRQPQVAEPRCRARDIAP